MKFTTTFLLVVGIISSAVNAKVAITSPYTSVTWQANQKYTVTWNDDGQEPLLKKLGTVNVDLITGSDGNYILVKNIANVKATQMKTPSWVVPKDLGPPGAYYFIRTTSGNNLSFSGKFDIQGITGTIPGFTPPTNTTNSTDPTNAPSAADPNTTDTTNATATTATTATATTPASSANLNSNSNYKSSDATLNANTFMISSIFLGFVNIALQYL